MRALIFGAGSIGNHMTNACLRLGIEVFITDIDFSALIRMKSIIFPKRYKRWDNNIKIVNFKELDNLKDKIFDIIIIGTPPSFHINLFFNILKNLKFNKILIEKPLSNVFNKDLKKLIKLKNKNNIFVGYNHSISKSFLFFQKILKKLLKKEKLKQVIVSWCEGWQGIMNAHFWMKSHEDSYLSSFKNGGGALQEHSHGLHLSYLLAKMFKKNFFKNFESMICLCNEKSKTYDYETNILSYNDYTIFKYTTNLYSIPANKKIDIFFDKTRVVWKCNARSNQDLIEVYSNNKIRKKFVFKKTRSSEFENEIRHILRINSLKKYFNSNIKVENGIEVQKIINSLAKNEKKFI